MTDISLGLIIFGWTGIAIGIIGVIARFINENVQIGLNILFFILGAVSLVVGYSLEVRANNEKSISPSVIGTAGLIDMPLT